MSNKDQKKGQPNGLLIGMISVAVAGLLAVQLALLNIAWDLKDQAFQRNVVSALAETVRDLEAGEIANNALQVIYRIDDGEDFSKAGLHQVQRHSPFQAPSLLRAPQEGTNPDSNRLDATFIVKQDNSGDAPFMQMVKMDSLVTWHAEFDDLGENRVELIQHIVGDLVVATPKPIRERLQPARIDSLLQSNLREIGIDIPPQFGVHSPQGGLLLASEGIGSAKEEQKLLASPLRAELFPLDLRPSAHQIILRFPGQRGFLMRQIGPLLAASLLFLLVIIATFVFTLLKIDQQGRFFARIIDFINNMTHEFKTPISTVSLASEALARPDILERPDALARYNGMIRDENLRMRRQVEKILQIAQLEAGDFDLHLTQVDINELARDTAEAFTLQVENRGGSLELDLHSPRSTVNGDHLHLGNVLANLIDNAIKYSPGQPRVEVRTAEQGDQLLLEVADHGPGIPRAQQGQVFEKYYRGPTGNRHDVKGYGLGLSFVRMLVEAHGGQVSLDSATDRGTKVSITLPLAPDQTSPERSDHE